MTRIHIADIIFDAARGLSKAGYFVKPQWGPLFTALSMGIATVAIRLIMFKQDRMLERVQFKCQDKELQLMK
jgi:hypothetical protein